jgi:hypothetical protein
VLDARRRSVLILPAAAAFQRFDLPEQTVPSGKEEIEWGQKLDKVLAKENE